MHFDEDKRQWNRKETFSEPLIHPEDMASVMQESAPDPKVDGGSADIPSLAASPTSLPTTPSRRTNSYRSSVLPSDSSMREVFVFSDLDISYKWEKSIALKIWDFCFGFFALADFSAAMAKRFIFVESTSDALLDRVILWLKENSDKIGISFSLLWFIDAFIVAHQKRIADIRKKDKEKLLSANIDDDDDDEDWWSGSRGVYYRTMVLQLLLLPVGFYVFCYNRLRQLHDPRVGDDDVIMVAHQIQDEVDESETFSSHASVCLGVALLKHVLITLSAFGPRIRLHGIAKAKSVIIREVKRGIRHPLRFHRRIKKTLRVVRWTKYLAPLIGTANKLKGNVSDLIKKYKQHREAEMAKTVRKKLWHDLTEEELREYCATLIQKTFRAHQARKKMYVVNVMKGQKDIIASIKLQSAFRGSLARARYRVKNKMEKLEELKEKEKMSLKKKGKVEMNADERRRMYVIQQELEDEAQHLLNEKLLLRPNTTFAVAWKILFVIAVLFEITILACKPILSKHRDPDTGKPLDLESVLDKVLIPSPISEWPACTDKESAKFNILHPVRSLWMIIKEIGNKKPEVEQAHPWYCGKFYLAIQRAYISVADVAIHHFLVIVGVICFLDVFITLFTGNINAETGALEPKPFFQRWIAPGLLLQLLLNPNVEDVSTVFFRAIDGLLHYGPVRMLRWTVALFYPLGLWTFQRMRDLWCLYASFQNQQLMLDEEPGGPSQIYLEI